MRVDRVKRAAALIILVMAAIAVGVVVLGAASVQEQASEGADPADAFTAVPAGVPALEDVVVWLPDAPLQERRVEPATRDAIEAAWTRAWQARQRSAAGDPGLLDTWFSGPALDQAEALASETEGAVDLRLGEHRLQVTFYSDDGSVLGLRASPVRVHRTVETAAGPAVLVTDESFEVVLLLEDGNWRIRQWHRTASTPVAPPLTGT